MCYDVTHGEVEVEVTCDGAAMLSIAVLQADDALVPVKAHVGVHG